MMLRVVYLPSTCKVWFHLPCSHHLPVLTQNICIPAHRHREPWAIMAIKLNKTSGLFFNSSLLPASRLPNFPHKVHVRKDFYLWLSSALVQFGFKVPLAILLWDVSKEWEESHTWRMYWEGSKEGYEKLANSVGMIMVMSCLISVSNILVLIRMKLICPNFLAQ